MDNEGFFINDHREVFEDEAKQPTKVRIPMSEEGKIALWSVLVDSAQRTQAHHQAQENMD